MRQRGAILTLPPTALWNGRDDECPIAWRCGIYVETWRATILQAARCRCSIEKSVQSVLSAFTIYVDSVQRNSENQRTKSKRL